MNTLLKFRYLFAVAVLFILINSLVFIILGVIECVNGYIEIVRADFETTEDQRPGLSLLEGLDYFVSSLVFMIFGLGLGQLFVFNNSSYRFLPAGLSVENLKELKVLLWETILVALVIFCVTHLLRVDFTSWKILPLPVLILVLAVALFFVKSDGYKKVRG